MISKLNHQMRVLFLPSIASASLHSHLLCNGIPLWFLLQLLLIPGVLSLLLRPLILAFFHSRCAFPARPFTDFRMKPNSCLCHQLGEIVTLRTFKHLPPSLSEIYPHQDSTPLFQWMKK
nr:uncharacterized protein LOC101256533 isoform X4 [Solanum lycopersicum]